LVSFGYFRAQDHEGGNGLAWSADPRTGAVESADGPSGFVWPSKYNVSPSGQLDPKTMYDGVRLRMGDGLEARLIQAEAALARGDGAWLTILNTLRATCVETTPCAPVPGLTSTTLAPLTDPGTPAARLDTLMKERAMWLYFTGHREGDLRRLAHVYHRDPTTLWPKGIYTSVDYPTLGIQSNPFYNGQPYGTAAVFQPRVSNEQGYNPLYSGCYDLNP